MTGTVSHMNSRTVQVIIGVDTHQDQPVAVAIDGRGVRLGEKHVPVATCGYEELERWSSNLGQVQAFGVEGTGSYGAGLAHCLACRGYMVIEVNRPDRSVRHRKGKSDPTDAEMTARSVLAGVAEAIPKPGVGEGEMIRMLKSVKNSAVKARTQTVNQVKALVVTAPAELREKLDGAGTGRSLWCRPRHGCGSADRRRQQPRSYQLRSCLRIAVWGESHSCIIRQDQPASAQPRWRPPGQCGAISHSRRQATPRSEDSGVPAPTNRRGNEQGRSIRCLKRQVAREVYSIIRKPNQILVKAT